MKQQRSGNRAPLVMVGIIAVLGAITVLQYNRYVTKTRVNDCGSRVRETRPPAGIKTTQMAQAKGTVGLRAPTPILGGARTRRSRTLWDSPQLCIEVSRVLTRRNIFSCSRARFKTLAYKLCLAPDLLSDSEQPHLRRNQ